ncbi:hypothetical protein [Deinococcus marmoris]|nr:hypothetical protein [Deinococcus marmoris]
MNPEPLEAEPPSLRRKPQEEKPGLISSSFTPSLARRTPCTKPQPRPD